MKIFLTKLLLIFLATSSFSQSTGSEGTEFWLAYLENLDLSFNSSPQFTLYIYATENGNGQVSAPATGLNFDFEYFANTVTEFALPTGVYYSEGSEAIANMGLKISTETTCRIYAIHYRSFFSEGTMLLATPALVDEYIVVAAADFNENVDSPSSFVIVATEDETSVEITPSQNTLGLRPKNIPFVVELNKGNTYQVQANGDLSGSKVRSLNNERIALFGGALKGDVACTIADNHLFDQVLPPEFAGQEFALVPFKGQGTSIFKAMALEDNTELFLDGEFQQILDRYELIEFDLDDAVILSSSKAMFCTQFSKSALCALNFIGDPNMLQLQPLKYTIKEVKFPNLTSFDFFPLSFSNQYVNLICASDKTQSVSLDDTNISWNIFENNIEYSYAQIEVNSDISSLLAPEGIQAFAYGFGDHDAYTYHLGFIPEEKPNSVDSDPNLQVNLGPNPSLEKLYLSANFKIQQYEIYSIDGKKVLQAENLENEIIIDIRSLPSSTYFIKIHSSSGSINSKFVKI